MLFHSIQFYSTSTAASVTTSSHLLQPVLAVGRQLGITSLSLISSCSHSIKKFRQTATDLGVLVGRILQVTKHSKVIGDVVKKFLEESVSEIKSICIFQSNLIILVILTYTSCPFLLYLVHSFYFCTHHTLFVRFSILAFSQISPFYFISYCLHVYIHIKVFLDKNINIASFYDLDNRGIGVWFPVVVRDFSSSPKHPDWLCGLLSLPVNGQQGL